MYTVLFKILPCLPLTYVSIIYSCFESIIQSLGDWPREKANDKGVGDEMDLMGQHDKWPSSHINLEPLFCRALYSLDV